MKKRMISIIIVMTIIMALMPTIVIANTVTYISNEAELRTIENDLSGNYVLTNNITLTSEWEPIGKNENTPFTGTLDGNGHSISGLNIYGTSKYAGLFGVIRDATIKDLIIANCNITTNVTGTDYYIGAITGYSNNSSIFDCAVTGDIKLYVYSSSVVFGVPFAMTDSYAGSITGYNSGTIERCNSYANVYVYSGYYAAYTGGVVGVNNRYGVLSECQFQGNVSCYTYTAVTDGGSGGIASHNNGIISNCCAKAYVATRGNYVHSGGITSRNSGVLSNNIYCGFLKTTIISSLFPDESSGNITSENFGTINTNYFILTPSESNEGIGNGESDNIISVAKSTAGNISMYPSLDFESTWTIYEDNMPGLKNVKYINIPTRGTTNSTSSNAPIITSATASLGGNTYNLFADKLNVDKDSTDTLSIEGSVDANGCSDVHLYITQGADKAIEIPLDACKDIRIGQEFSAGTPIYMLAIDKATGKSTSKRTKLNVVGDGMFDGSLSSGDINLIEDFGVDIPDDVPVLGGQKFGLSLGSISSEVEVDGNEFKISLGTDFLEGKKGADGKWKKEDWTGFKQGFKDAKEAMRKNASAYKYLTKIAPKGTKMEMSQGVGGSANVTGYIEGYIDDSGIHPTEGGIIVSAEIKYKYQGMIVVVVVPVYYEIGAGGELTFVGGVKDLVLGNGLQGAFTGSITPTVFFEIGGGVGVPMALTAGVSGKVKAELEIALSKVYQKLDITGTASFKLTGPFGVPTYTKPFANGTFHVYETGNKNTLLGKTLNLYSVQEDINNMYAYIDIDEPIEITPHDDSTQEWIGDENQIQLFVADYTNQDVNVLEENSYESIAPVFAEMGGKNVIAWITDNKDRADGDKTMLVYSVVENGAWSEPKAVYDDGLADYTPIMKDGYIVWQKAVDHITDGMTSRNLGEISEIYLAKWNGDGFDEPIRVTDNNLIDQTPTLAVNNGEPTVVWVQNSENDFTGLTGENKIMSYTGGTATVEQTVTDAVTYIDCMYIGNGLNIAYETDSDSDFNTLTDREIYTISNGTKTQITNNSLIDTHPVYADFNGNTTLFYYSDGKIVYLENGAESVITNNGVLTDQFTVISNSNNVAVLWTSVNDGSAEIHGALYDGMEWSEDVQISDLGQRIKYPSAVMNEDGSIFAVFNRTEKVSDGDDYYVDGQSDLCTIKIIPSYDLELSDAYFDEETMTAYATVKNNGELAVDGYTITITDNGINSQRTVTEPLKAGESAEIEIEYNKGADFSARTIELSVALISGDEYNENNNSAEFSIGHADIDVDNVSVDKDETVISADISNIGYDNAQNVNVQLRDGSVDGAVIEEKTINLAVGAEESVDFTIDKSTMHFFDATKQLYVVAGYSDDEVSLGNNEGYVVITSMSGVADYETEILSYNEIDGKYVINSIARNNTAKAVSCTMYSAVYSSDGTVKACGIVKADIEADNDTGVDISVPCMIETGDTVKTFMWTDKLEPLATIGEFIIE